MTEERKTMACYIAVLAMCILFFGWILAGQSYTDDKFDFYQTDRLTVVLQNRGQPQIYDCVLPKGFETSQSLLFKTTHAVVEVLLDDTVVYTYGTQKQLPGKSPGAYWHAVSIPEGSNGRHLVIRLTAAYDSFYEGPLDVRYGSRGDCILALVSSFLPILVLNFAIVVMGLVSLLLFAQTVNRRRKWDRTGFLCIGLFSLLLAIWSLRQCGFLQFLIPSGQILYFVDILLLFLLVPPINIFFYSISLTKWKKGFLWISLLYLAGMVIGMILQLAGVVDIFELLPAFHILTAANGIYMLWGIHWEVGEHKGGMVGKFRLPFYTLILFGILEIITYYFPRFGLSPVFGGMSLFLPLGAMLFILMLIWQQVEDFYQGMLEEQELLYYEKLANTDMLTGAFSRNAYENILKEFNRESGTKRFITVLFDLNNLKTINDSFGHEKGDEAIKHCHDLILTAFGDKGNCYRIGGDEFVFLAQDEMDIEPKIADFNNLVVKTQERLDYPFSVALGYAVFDEALDKDLQDTIRRSDAMMYIDKKKKKKATVV